MPLLSLGLLLVAGLPPAASFPACYHDLAALSKPGSWLVQANPDFDKQMTEPKCLELCTAKQALPLIVLQNFGACYCAKALPSSAAARKVPISACVANAGCPGNASTSCGSPSAALVLNTMHGLTPVATAPPPPKLPLLPHPKAVTYLGATRVPASVQLALSGTTLSAEIDLPTLTADLLTVISASSSADGVAADATLSMRLAPGMKPEEYALDANDTQWTITGGGSTGVWWGTRTLLQIWSKGAGAEAAALRVSDSPLVAHRSLMVDCAREHLSLDFHVTTIKRLSALKMSSYHLHLSDDSGYHLRHHAFRSDRHLPYMLATLRYI
jgi:hypothetical protein